MSTYNYDLSRILMQKTARHDDKLIIIISALITYSIFYTSIIYISLKSGYYAYYCIIVLHYKLIITRFKRQ